MSSVMPAPELINVKKNLAEVKQQVRDDEILFARVPHSVFLLAVSKGQSIEKIKQAISAGQIAFGENHLQEALPKIAAFSEEKLEWHFIGLIQSNKTKKIAEHFNWVHSVTDTRIAKRLSEQRPTHLPPLNICLQVNVDQSLDEVTMLADYCAALPHLKIRGLMAIPIPKNTFEEQRIEFKKVAALFHALNKKNFQLDTLSIGMSKFEIDYSYLVS
jgi:pyridoxal phosphate enzyme (YggS family)